MENTFGGGFFGGWIFIGLLLLGSLGVVIATAIVFGLAYIAYYVCHKFWLLIDATARILQAALRWFSFWFSSLANLRQLLRRLGQGLLTFSQVVLIVGIAAGFVASPCLLLYFQTGKSIAFLAGLSAMGLCLSAIPAIGMLWVTDGPIGRKVRYASTALLAGPFCVTGLVAWGVLG